MPDRPPRPSLMVDSVTLFGRCVAVMRKDSGLSQAAVAEHLGISRPALTHIETGRTPPTFYLFLRIGAFVGKRRLDGDPTALHALYHLAARALSAEGIRVRNRPRRDDDVVADTARIDRVVGTIYHRKFQELVPVQIVRFDGDADEPFAWGDPDPD